MLRKISLILLCGIFLLGLCGCSDSSNDDYENKKKCWDKGMDYDSSTGRCLTANEAYNQCLRDPDCDWAK